jgi:hypothetical protein
MLPSPPWDQSLTAMLEANDFKGPTSGMVLTIGRRFPVYPDEQTF